MSGRIGDLSPRQSAALDQFKKNLEDVIQPHYDDRYLLRWLRARKFDLVKSERMLRDSLSWREMNNVDAILSDWRAPPVLLQYYPGGLSGGHDKQGSPIWIDMPGRCDIRGILHSVKKSDIIRKMIQECEIMQSVFTNNSKKFGKPVEGLCIIVDLEYFGLKHLWKPGMDVTAEVMAMFEANYPEVMKCCFIVNAPRFFPVAYNLVKPFLSDETRKKFFLLGENWKERLLEFIDADQLPAHWGGTATDPDGDPFCRSKFSLGGPVPKELYIQKENFVDMSQFRTVPVGRASHVEVRAQVDSPGSLLRWQFWTEQGDIAFEICRQTCNDKNKNTRVVVPRQRVNTHMVPEDGMLMDTEPGTYVLRFDNSHSLTKKTLRHLVEVVPPETEKTTKGNPR